MHTSKPSANLQISRVPSPLPPIQYLAAATPTLAAVAGFILETGMRSEEASRYRLPLCAEKSIPEGRAW
jgi:hypothetical protein